MSDGIRVTPGAEISCSRCTKTTIVGSKSSQGWNIEFAKGTPVGFVCPECQTLEENSEAVVNEATMDYGSVGRNDDGQMTMRPKA